MSYFIFNGVNSDDLGIMLTATPVRPSWKKESTEFTIAGKSKKYIQQSETYDNQSMTIDAFIDDISQANLQKIYNLFQGEGELLLSTNLNEYLNVIAEPPSIKAIALTSGECSLKFTVKPFAYSLNPTTANISDEGNFVKIHNNSPFISEPLISFSPQTQLTVINTNGSEFSVTTPDGCSYESTIFIDSEEHIVYFQRPEGTIYPCTQYTTGEFPRLHKGENYIMYTGTTQNFKINAKERYL